MESFLVSIAVAAVSGLAWLCYHHSTLASKVVAAFFILLVIVHAGFIIYAFGWSDSHHTTEIIVARTIAKDDSLEGKRMDHLLVKDNQKLYEWIRKLHSKINADINADLETAACQETENSNNANYIFYLAYGILIGLVILSRIFTWNKRQLRPDM